MVTKPESVAIVTGSNLIVSSNPAGFETDAALAIAAPLLGELSLLATFDKLGTINSIQSLVIAPSGDGHVSFDGPLFSGGGGAFGRAAGGELALAPGLADQQELLDEAEGDVAADQEDEDGGLGDADGDDDGAHEEQGDHREGALGEAEVLHRAEADARDHEPAEHRDHHADQHVVGGLVDADDVEAHHERDDDGRGHGDRQAEHVLAGLLVLVVVLLAQADDVEAGQTEGAAGDEQERDEQAGLAEALEAPAVDDKRRGDAEGDDVGEAVEVEAELALGLGEAGDAAIGGVEEQADEDRQRGLVERVAVAALGVEAGRDGDRIEAAEHPREGEEVRQEEVGLPKVHERNGRASGQGARLPMP